MADFDEEIRRQAAISSLLAQQPDTTDASDSDQGYAESMAPVIKPDTQADYHKLINQVFDTKTDEQVTAQPDITVYPTIAQDQGQPDKKFDTVTDQQVVAPAPDQLSQVERGELVKAPDMGERGAPLDTKVDEQVVDTPVDARGMPLDLKPAPQPLDKGEAPAQLTQVERGELVGLPWHPAVKPNVPGFIEGSTNAIANPAAGVIPPTPVTAPAAPSAATPSVATPSAISTPEATPTPTPEATPTPADQPQVIQPTTTEDYNKLVDSWFPSADSKAKTAIQADVTGQDNSGVADYFRKSGEAPITSENDPRLTQINVGGSKWNVHREAAPYFQGFLQELANQGAPMRSDGGWNYRNKVGASGLSEHSWAGAIDLNQDGRGIVTPAFQQWIQDHPGALQAAEQHWHIYGGERFGDLGHFEWGGVGGGGGEDKTAAASGAEEPPINTLVKLDQSGLNVTHFGYEKPGEPGYDPDSAKGNGKYVENLIPGYDVSLNSAAAHLVGDPKPGETFQFAGREWRYGDAVSEKLTDPRFDIFDPTGTALTGSMPVGKQVAATAEAKDKMPWDDWPKLSPEDQAAAEKEGQVKQQGEAAILQSISDQTPNKGQLWNKLQGDIPGVSQATLQNYRDQVKKQITDYALDYYKASNPKITPDEAFNTATSDPNFGTYLGEVWSKVMPNFQHMAIAGARSQDVQEENAVNQFFKAANPDSTAEQRVQLKRQFMAMDPQHRKEVIGQMLGGNGDAAVADRMSTIDAPTLYDAFDHISNPAYQASRKIEIAKAVAQNERDLQPDPRIAGTPGAIATSLLSSMPKNMFEMGTGVYGESAMLQEIYFDTKDQLAKEHPDWSDDKLKDTASASTMAQMGPQMVIMRLGGGALNAMTKGIEQPLLELGARLGIHSTAGGLMAGVQQLMKNVTTGHPPMEGVQDAVVSGAAQTGIAVGIHGAISGHGPEAPPEAKAEAVPPPLPETKPAEPSPRPVTRGEILGPDEPPLPEPLAPWYRNQVTAGQDPLVIRGAERTAFTPQEVADLVDRAPSGSTPEELRSFLDKVQSPVGLHLGDEGTLETEQAWRAQVQTPEPPMTVAEAIQKAKADSVAASLGGTLAAPRRPALSLPASPPRVGESEPFVSKVANRYTAERMASGELGQVDPSQGTSTEELVRQGMQMSPTQREGLIDNFVKGTGGDLDQQGAAIRSKEAMLSLQSTEASRASEVDPTNQQLKAEADAALKAVTDFHNGPVKKLKRVWSDAGRGLQREIPLDYTTLNGMKEAYLKGTGNGKEAPPEMEPKLKQTAARVRKAASDEQAAVNKWGQEIEKRTRGKVMPNDDSIRAKLMEIMRDLPCRN